MSARLDEETAALVKQAKREAEQPHRFTFWDCSDDSLIQLRRQYLRMIEDNPDRKHAMIDGWLASIRWVRLVRWCLRMRYGAVDEHLGTKEWFRYLKHDEPPAYSLALRLDQMRWELRDKLPSRGTRRAILDWSKIPHEPSLYAPSVTGRTST